MLGFFVYFNILCGGERPGKLLLHCLMAHLFPGGGIAIKVEGSLDGSQKIFRIEI